MGLSFTLLSSTPTSYSTNMANTTLAFLCVCLVAAVAGSHPGYGSSYDYGYSVGSGSPGHSTTYAHGHSSYIAPQHHTYTYPTTYTVAYPVHHGYAHGHGVHGLHGAHGVHGLHGAHGVHGLHGA